MWIHQDPPCSSTNRHQLVARIHYVDPPGFVRSITEIHQDPPLESNWINLWEYQNSQLGSNRTQHVIPSRATTWIKPDPSGSTNTKWIHQHPPSGYTSIHHGDPPRGSTRLSVQYVDTPGSIKWIHQDPSRGSTRIQHSGSKENQKWWIIAIWNFYFFPPNMIFRARTPEFIYYGNWISKSPILLKRIKFLHVFNNKHHYVCPLFILTYW